MELLMFGRWRRKATSNSLECAAVERALCTLKQTTAGKDLTSVVIRSDNTATCYNINRQNACDTLLPSLQRLLRFLDRSNLEVVAEHIAGVDNGIADKLSRISPGGDYSLRQGQLDRLQQQLGVQIGADLFASGWSRQHHRYFSPEKDRNALGRNAFLVPWSNFSMPLLHPPLPLLPRVLQRLLQEKIQAIIVAPHWLRAPWSETLRRMIVRKTILGPCETVLMKGRRMGTVRAELPPGDIAAYLVDTRTTQGKSASNNT
jgi:hypothetical protein